MNSVNTASRGGLASCSCVCSLLRSERASRHICSYSSN